MINSETDNPTEHLLPQREPAFGLSAEKPLGGKCLAKTGHRPQEANQYPTGAEMVERTEKHGEMVREVMLERAGTRGDDNLLWLYVVKKYYWRFVEIRTSNNKISINCDFETFFMLPSFESIRRRRQEIQAAELKAIERGEKTSSNLLPTQRVVRKRARKEMAMKHYHGEGQFRMSDYLR